MFFKYRIYEKKDTILSISATTVMATEGLTYRDFIDSALFGAIGGEGTPIGRIEWHIGMPVSVRKKIGDRYIKNDEGYALVLGKTVKVYAATERGFIYAAATLSSLASGGELYEGFLYDVPLAEERGYRVYLPARAGFEGFYRMVDFLATYKFNAIILEIGGAMEYHRHPEINRAWDEFCRDVRRFSGRTKEIQFKTYQWPKNSIHCDNAEGDILTHEECRTLAAYCRSRGLDVIPECPSLSHTDFLVLAHPELREREEDLHPDTYCPRHPDVYTYVFDILEEVIEVFEPRAINIGHDETYSIGICPRCKGTPAYELYAEDVKKIHAFLTERGIHVYMWGEKLLNAHWKGHLIGGAGHGKGTWHVPSLWPSRDLLPRENITYLHWYWQFNPDYDKIYHERDMRAVFGNMNPLALENYTMRATRGIKGGFVSNWGSFTTEHMQKNQQYLSLYAAAYIFFCEGFADADKADLLRLCFEEGYRTFTAGIKHPIEITHTTSCTIPFEYAYDGIFVTDEKYLLGNYELTYTDGTVATLPVRYGSHIGNATPKKTLGNAEFTQLVYMTLPVAYGGGYAYRTAYEDPHPEKTLSAIRYVPVESKKDIPVSLIGVSRRIERDMTATVAVCTDTEHSDTVAGVQE